MQRHSRLRILPFLALLPLGLLACSSGLEWVSSDNPGNACHPARYYRGDPRWNASFGSRLGIAHGCLHVFYGNDSAQTKSTSQTPVVLNLSGQILGLGSEAPCYEATTQIALSGSASNEKRRFRVYVLPEGAYTQEKHSKLCEQQAEKAKDAPDGFDCFASDNQNLCWFYFEFRPSIKNGQTAPPVATAQDTYCQLVAQRPDPNGNTPAVPELPEFSAPANEPKNRYCPGTTPPPASASIQDHCVRFRSASKAWEQVHKVAIKQLAFHPKNEHLISLDEDGILKHWDRKTGTPTSTEIEKAARFLVSKTGEFFATIDKAPVAPATTQRLRIWKLNLNNNVLSLTSPRSLDTQQNNITSLVLSPDFSDVREDASVLTASEDGRIFRWLLAIDNNSRHTGRVGNPQEGLIAMDASSENGIIATIHKNLNVTLWKTRTTSSPTEFSQGESKKTDVPGHLISFSPNNEHFLVAHGQKITNFNQSNDRFQDTQQTIPLHSKARALAWSANGEMFFVLHEDGNITLWHREKRVRIFTIPPAKILDNATALAIAPNGRTLAIGYPNGTINLWECD